MEATLSLGLMSVGLLTLVPLLVVGMQSARLAKQDRSTAWIAQTLIEEFRQGTLGPGTSYLDEQGKECSTPSAIFTAEATLQPMTGSTTLRQLKLRVVPVGAPERARTYAVILPLSS